jgi:hypothetical protein
MQFAVRETTWPPFQAPEAVPLPFELLMAKLKRLGFVVGVDHRLRLHALLKGLNTGGRRPPRI